MFELPSLSTAVQLIILIVLLYWTIKSNYDESEKRKIRNKEEKALISDLTFLTTTRVKFERHLWMLLDHVASYKLQHVIITDEKEVPQSVLLPYAEYKSFLDFKHLYEDNAEEKSKSIFCCNKSKEISNEF